MSLDYGWCHGLLRRLSQGAWWWILAAGVDIDIQLAEMQEVPRSLLRRVLRVARKGNEATWPLVVVSHDCEHLSRMPGRHPAL